MTWTGSRARQALVALLVLNALVAIVIVLFGEFSRTEGRILATTICVTGATAALLVFRAGSRHPFGGPFAAVGFAATITCFGLLMLAIWTDAFGATFGRLLASALITLAGAAIVVLAVSAGEARQVSRLDVAAAALVSLTSSVAVGFVWAEPDDEVWFRLFTALAVLTSAVVLVAVVVRVRDRNGGPLTSPEGRSAQSETAELAKRFGIACQRTGLTVAVAESLTAGALQAALGVHSGASEWFRGGVVPYSIDLKASLLGVDLTEAEPVAAVSTLTAQQMATGVRDLASADIGLAVTGMAEPDPDHSTWFPRAAYAIALGERCWSGWLPGAGLARDEMIDHVVREALRAALLIVESRSQYPAHPGIAPTR